LIGIKVAVVCWLAALVVPFAAQERRESQSDRIRSVMKVSATAYCTKGQTYAGTRARRGIVAADPRVLPIGTVVRVDGLPKGFNRTYRVEDTGRAIKGREIDVFVSDCDAAERFGRRDARVRIVQLPPERDRR
jgi:3D (Asp-Asp-Asp) domain-containing protein